MSEINRWLNRYSVFFATLTQQELDRCDQLFSQQVHFKDPFNDVTGIASVKQVFRHMFDTCETVRFEIHDCSGHGSVGYINWTFHFMIKRRWKQRKIQGVSRVAFNAKGEVVEHIDYWDAAENIYQSLPLIGWLLKQLRNRFLRAA